MNLIWIFRDENESVVIQQETVDFLSASKNRQSRVHGRPYLYSYSYRVSLFNRTVLRGVMQCCGLVGKGEFSASIGTAGDCCVVSGGQVEVRSRRQEPQWRNLKLL